MLQREFGRQSDRCADGRFGRLAGAAAGAGFQARCSFGFLQVGAHFLGVTRHSLFGPVGRRVDDGVHLRLLQHTTLSGVLAVASVAVFVAHGDPEPVDGVVRGAEGGPGAPAEAGVGVKRMDFAVAAAVALAQENNLVPAVAVQVAGVDAHIGFGLLFVLEEIERSTAALPR